MADAAAGGGCEAGAPAEDGSHPGAAAAAAVAAGAADAVEGHGAPEPPEPPEPPGAGPAARERGRAEVEEAAEAEEAGEAEKAAAGPRRKELSEDGVEGPAREAEVLPIFHPNAVSPTAPPQLSCVSDPLGGYGDIDRLFDELILTLREGFLIGDEKKFNKAVRVNDLTGGAFEVVKVADGQKLRAIGQGNPDGSDVVTSVTTARGSREDLEMSWTDSASRSLSKLRFAVEPLRLETWAEIAGARVTGEIVAESFTRLLLHRTLERMQQGSESSAPPGTFGSYTTLFAAAARGAAMFLPSRASCPWLQFKLSSTTTVTSIQTKQCAEEPQWLETFSLSYSNDGEDWAQHAGVLHGNDSGTLDEVQVEPPIVAKFIRIHPMKWQIHEQGSPSFEMRCGMMPPPYAHEEAMTISDAKEMCKRHPDKFAGFTFKGVPEADGPQTIMFNDRCDGIEEVAGGGFMACLSAHGKIPELSPIEAFTVFHGTMLPGNDIAVEDLTLEEAKVRCAELEGCHGFCFQGDLHPCRAKLRVYFKSSPWVQGRGLALGWVTCLCGSGAARAAAVRPPATPAAAVRLGVLDNARPTECMTLSHVFDGPLDGARLRGAFERVVAGNPLLAGRLHRSKPLWKWEVRFDGDVGARFRVRTMPPSAHTWLLGLDAKAIAKEFGRVRLLHGSILGIESGDVGLMEGGAAPLCYLTHCVGRRASVVAMSLSQKLADEWCIRALFRLLEEEFAAPGSSRPLAGLEGVDAATQGVHLVASPSGKLRMLHALECHRPAATGGPLARLARLARLTPLAWLRGQLHRGAHLYACPRRGGGDVARRVVAVAPTGEALAAVASSAPGASPSAALATWIGNAAASPHLRVAVNYRGSLRGVPRDCIGNALGLQDCMPAWWGFRAADVERAVSRPENNFGYAEVDSLPEDWDTVLSFEEPQPSLLLGTRLLATLPPMAWGSLDPTGVHRLSCCAPGQYLVTHTVQGDRAARRLQAAWLHLGQEAQIFPV